METRSKRAAPVSARGVNIGETTSNTENDKPKKKKETKTTDTANIFTSGTSLVIVQ